MNPEGDRLAKLESDVQDMKVQLIEARAFGTVAMVVAEQAIAALVVDRPDADHLLTELNRRGRERLTPIAQDPRYQQLAAQMFQQLEAVLLHAAVYGQPKN